MTPPGSDGLQNRVCWILFLSLDLQNLQTVVLVLDITGRGEPGLNSRWSRSPQTSSRSRPQRSRSSLPGEQQNHVSDQNQRSGSGRTQPECCYRVSAGLDWSGGSRTGSNFILLGFRSKLQQRTTRTIRTRITRTIRCSTTGPDSTDKLGFTWNLDQNNELDMLVQLSSDWLDLKSRTSADGIRA